MFFSELNFRYPAILRNKSDNKSKEEFLLISAQYYSLLSSTMYQLELMTRLIATSCVRCVS